jgi:hypothetical protein
LRRAFIAHLEGNARPDCSCVAHRSETVDCSHSRDDKTKPAGREHRCGSHHADVRRPERRQFRTGNDQSGGRPLSRGIGKKNRPVEKYEGQL